ncbi:MFS transporter, partial [Salmonella enterica]|uniref:MFS transporter n=1 Tax=Salmonella enterica TaxID=28901 RepID=UPI0039F1DEEB
MKENEKGWGVLSIVIGCIIGVLGGGKNVDKMGGKDGFLMIVIIFLAFFLGV